MAAPEKLLQFQLPEVAEVKAYIVRMPDGRVVARTEEELAELAEGKGPEGGGSSGVVESQKKV